MPRKERIEYPGARYHIISRGNYRKNLFTVGKSGEAFERALFEVVERCGWRLYAYVIMSNHYHLAVETPEPNLVVGMKWLQGTFATRFNRFHGERGHVFQGRYKALLLEEDRSLLGLIHYIHLNPVRARMCSIAELKTYALSSYAKYWGRKPPKVLQREAVLELADLPSGLAGMRRYEELLKLSEEANRKHWDELHTRYCRGWYLGPAQDRKALVRKLQSEQPHASWRGAVREDFEEEKWERWTAEYLKKMKKGDEDIARDRKGAPWKVKIALRLRHGTTASNPWIAKRLNMGHPNRVSNLLNEQKH